MTAHRRVTRLSIVAIAAVALLPATTVSTSAAASQRPVGHRAAHWVGSWATAPQRARGGLNEGIIGNRLLAASPPLMPYLGDAALARLDRDALTRTGARYLIVLIGINDIGFPGSVDPAEAAVTADDLIIGYRRIVARAREHGIKTIGATLTPFEKAQAGPGYYSVGKKLVRERVNRWVRSSGELAGVIDFDRAIRDPLHPTRLLPAFDSGDHLHPNDAGHGAMAQAIDLHLFGSGEPD